MAHPPGIGSTAFPVRPSKAPKNNTEERILEASVARISHRLMQEASTYTVLPKRLTPHPSSLIIWRVSSTSLISGQFSILQVPSLSIQDTKMGSAAFLEP